MSMSAKPFVVHFACPRNDQRAIMNARLEGLSLLDFLREATNTNVTMGDLPNYRVAATFAGDPLVGIDEATARRAGAFENQTHLDVKVGAGQLDGYVRLDLVQLETGAVVIATLDEAQLLRDWFADQTPLDWRPPPGPNDEPEEQEQSGGFRIGPFRL